MRVIIAGSRHARGALWEHALLDVLRAFQRELGAIACVVSGQQRGMDSIGEEWVADALVCLHIGGNGSADVIRRARQKGLLVIDMDMRKY